MQIEEREIRTFDAAVAFLSTFLFARAGRGDQNNELDCSKVKSPCDAPLVNQRQQTREEEDEK